MESGDRQKTVTRLPGQADGAVITDQDGTLLSSETVDGLYEISATTRIDGGVPGWSRRIRFVADAVPHSDLAGAAFKEPLVREWLSHESTPLRTVWAQESQWNDDDPASIDTPEAVYAMGRSGLSDTEVIDAIGRSTEGRVEPWSVLRTIQESGFLEARHRNGWRGRVWTLGKPILMPVDGNLPSSLVVEGALCAALEREFREVVLGLHGKPFRHVGFSPWAPPVVGACGVDPNSLATRLGWRVSAVGPAAPRLRPLALETSGLMGEHHELASSWDWNRRQFVKGPVKPPRYR